MTPRTALQGWGAFFSTSLGERRVGDPLLEPLQEQRRVGQRLVGRLGSQQLGELVLEAGPGIAGQQFVDRSAAHLLAAGAGDVAGHARLQQEDLGFLGRRKGRGHVQDHGPVQPVAAGQRPAVALGQLGAGIRAEMLERPEGISKAGREPDVVQDASHVQQLLVIAHPVAGCQQGRVEVGAQGMAVEHWRGFGAGEAFGLCGGCRVGDPDVGQPPEVVPGASGQRPRLVGEVPAGTLRWNWGGHAATACTWGSWWTGMLTELAMKQARWAAACRAIAASTIAGEATLTWGRSTTSVKRPPSPVSVMVPWAWST